MAFTATLTPFQLSDTETWTAAKFNLGFNPTITVAGNFADLSDYSPVVATSKVFTVFDLATDILRVAAGHGFATFQRVKVSNSGGALPLGLTAGVEYYVKTVDATDFTLHYTYAGAGAGTDRVNVTDAGTGTQTISYFTYATGKPLIRDEAGGTWEYGLVSPENLPEYQGNTNLVPGVRGAVPPAPPTTGSDYYLNARGVWTLFPTPSNVGNDLYLNENVY